MMLSTPLISKELNIQSSHQNCNFLQEGELNKTRYESVGFFCGQSWARRAHEGFDIKRRKPSGLQVHEL